MGGTNVGMTVELNTVFTLLHMWNEAKLVIQVHIQKLKLFLAFKTALFICYMFDRPCIIAFFMFVNLFAFIFTLIMKYASTNPRRGSDCNTLFLNIFNQPINSVYFHFCDVKKKAS